MDVKDTNILFVIPTLNVGGAEHQTIQQVNELHRQGFNVLLCLTGSDAALLKQVNLPAEKIYFLKGKGNTLTFRALTGSLSKVGRLVKICKKEKITHIIANLPLGHWYGRMSKLFRSNVRLINYHRSLQYDASPLNTRSKKIFNSIQAVLAKRTDDVSICISQAVKKNISAFFPLKNPTVLYNSVPDRYAQVTEGLARIGGNRIEIILPGRFHTSKGQLFFLPVCKHILTLFPGVHFKFAGGGPLEQEMRNYISSHSLDEKITITGHLPNSELLKEIYQADIVAIPSLHEGLGNVAMEALMLGKTIIASDAGGLKEIITDGRNGYLFPAADEAACIAVFKKMLETYPAGLLSSSGLRDDYQKRFSFETHIAGLKKIIDRSSGKEVAAILN